MRTETTPRPLRDLVPGFHCGAILLPQFQRDHLWRSAKIRNLLDSLLKGFPIGGFYLWQPANHPQIFDSLSIYAYNTILYATALTNGNS